MNLEEIKAAIAKLTLDERKELLRWCNGENAAKVAALARERERKLERKHREGYLQKPFTPDEFEWE